MKVTLIIVFILVTLGSQCQTYEEWFRQKKTQEKYLLQQIAAFKTFTNYAQKGFSIANNGLRTIKNIKNGDFNLHNDFFKSKSHVNPRILRYTKVAEIIAIQILITKQSRNTIKNCRSAKQLTEAELNYLQQVFNNLLDECLKNLQQLIQLISDGEFEMKDDERLKRIDRLYGDMKDKQMFVQVFGNGAKAISVQRLNDQHNIEIERKLNGIR